MTDSTRRRFMAQTGALAGAAFFGGAAPLAHGARGTLGFSSAIELAGKVRSREISAVELTRYFIDRIERYDGKLNAVVVRDFEGALKAAAAADAKRHAAQAAGRCV